MDLKELGQASHQLDVLLCWVYCYKDRAAPLWSDHLGLDASSTTH